MFESPRGMIEALKISKTSKYAVFGEGNFRFKVSDPWAKFECWLHGGKIEDCFPELSVDEHIWLQTGVVLDRLEEEEDWDLTEED